MPAHGRVRVPVYRGGAFEVRPDGTWSVSLDGPWTQTDYRLLHYWLQSQRGAHYSVWRGLCHILLINRRKRYPEFQAMLRAARKLREPLLAADWGAWDACIMEFELEWANQKVASLAPLAQAWLAFKEKVSSGGKLSATSRGDPVRVAVKRLADEHKAKGTPRHKWASEIALALALEKPPKTTPVQPRRVREILKELGYPSLRQKRH